MRSRTRIKICGMTDLEEVRHAVAAGVDALGFIFAKASPRYIEPERARVIISSLPPFVDAVGVFLNDEADRVAEIVQYCNVTVIQLHGSESPDYCRRFRTRVIKAFQVHDKLTAGDLFAYEDVVSGFLLDTYDKKQAGGTGTTFDWSLIHKLQPGKPLILAGGLGPANVAQAITAVRPFAVDINSAIETEPGRKDPVLISRLVEAVAATF
ncbi:MAG: phosphoribosylanthranilate isomerase [Proteobacteria bacterium]|nr:phosphoribosylanthranilate isomerase [Pseudomonadota bacterium]MBU0968161.1 phosphoribosylanthranilate isomerase [Pseudomonadota bacterium]